MATETKLNAWIPETELIFRENQVVEPFDLTFHNLLYTTAAKETPARVILHNISGVFKSGQLTAILGPSGAGKTTLMNILAGLKTSGVEGQLRVNGIKRDPKEFRKQSSYITQKDHLLPHLTVEEYMFSAAHLKLGNDITLEKKKLTIENVLKTLGLTNTNKTRISCLSGGECKRLSIALELVDNPAILFLDEPTSGLDSTSTLQCVALLRDISRSGRTVVTTIHQPSSRLLDYFDHLYIVSDGSCAYQGPGKSLVPYFKSLNLNCPSYHNPADFALDVVCGEYGNFQEKLITAIENGRIIYSETSTSTTASSLNHEFEEEDDFEKLGQKKKCNINCAAFETYAAPFHTQVLVLLLRTWRSDLREKILSWLRLLMNIAVGVVMGFLYWQIGNEATGVLHNAALLFLSTIFTLFSAGMPQLVTFPIERKILLREHLNHWYSVKAYYVAKILVDIPFQIVCPTVFLLIVYPVTNQPMDIERFFMLLGIFIGMAFTGQSIGLLSGAMFSMRAAVFVGPTVTLPFILLAGFLVTFNTMPMFMYWITYSSYARYAFEGAMITIYGYDRPPLECSLPFCMFRHPEDFLEIFSLTESSYFLSMTAIFVIVLMLKFVTYFVLRAKLRQSS